MNYYFFLLLLISIQISLINSISIQKFSLILLKSKSYKVNKQSNLSFSLKENPSINKYIRQIKSLFSSNLEGLILKLTEPTSEDVDNDLLEELITALINSPPSLSVETIIKISRKLKEKSSYTQLKCIYLLHILSTKLISNAFIIKNLDKKKDPKLNLYYLHRYDLFSDKYVNLFKKELKEKHKLISKHKEFDANEILYARVLPSYGNYLESLIKLNNEKIYDKKDINSLSSIDKEDGIQKFDEYNDYNDHEYEDSDDSDEEELINDKLIQDKMKNSLNIFSSITQKSVHDLIVKQNNILKILNDCPPSKLKKQIKSVLMNDKETLNSLIN